VLVGQLTRLPTTVAQTNFVSSCCQTDPVTLTLTFVANDATRRMLADTFAASIRINADIRNVVLSSVAV
jgi:hypothetical protein